MRAHRVSATVAAAALSGFLAACRPAPSPPPAGEAAPPARSGPAASGTARGTESAICSASSSYTVLQVGKTDTGDRKKVADNCWWQFRVPDLHGYVDEPLGWQLCNACDVNIEFELKNVAASAMTGCGAFFDASGATTRNVASGSTWPLSCWGLSVVTNNMYDVGARVQGASTPFVADDPELEIEDRGFAPYVMRLAETAGLSYCLSPGFGTGRRVSVTGQFARLNATGAIVLVPTGPGRFSTTWGVDLVEIAQRTGAALPEQQRSTAFTLSADVPAFVSNFIVRDSNGPKDALSVGQLSPCK